MSAVVRIFGKDLRRFWPFSALIVIAAVITSWFPSLGFGLNSDRAISGLDDLRCVGLCVLMLYLVQDDPVVSDRAAWLTRPMSGGAVWSAKALFLLVTILLPFAVTTFASCMHLRLTLGDALAVAFLATLRYGFIAAAFGFIAAITANVLGAAYVLGGAVVGLAVIIPYLQLVTTSPVAINPANATWHTTAAAVALLTGLTYFLFRARRRRVTVCAGVAAGILLLFALQALDQPSSASKPVPGLTIRSLDAQPFVGADLLRPFPFADAWVLALTIRQESSADHDYTVFPERGRFLGDDGRQTAGLISERDQIQSGSLEAEPVSTPWSAFGHVCRAVFQVSPPARDTTKFRPILPIAADAWQRWAGATGSLEATFRVVDSEYRGQGTLPLRVGATAPIPGYSATVHRIRYVEDGTLEVALDVQLVNMNGYHAFRPLWALVNDQTGEVSLQEWGRNVEQTYVASYLLDSERTTASFDHRWKPGSGIIARGGLTKDWVDHAHFVYVTVRQGKVADAVLTVPHIQIPRIGGAL